MHFDGIIYAIITFLSIGIFHPIVIKGEYHFSKKIWPVFLFFGVVCIVISFFITNRYINTLFAIVGASALWGIHELFEQEKRVEKGWFPKKRKKKD